MSGTAALVLSLATLNVGSDFDLTLLKANVLGAPTPGIETQETTLTDLAFIRDGRELRVVLEKDAYSVDRISFSLLGDPEKFNSLVSADAGVSILSNEPGVYRVTLSLDRDVSAHTTIATFTSSLTQGEMIAPVDGFFESKGETYSLSMESR